MNSALKTLALITGCSICSAFAADTKNPSFTLTVPKESLFASAAEVLDACKSCDQTNLTLRITSAADPKKIDITLTVPDEPVIVRTDAKGSFKLDANDAELHGDQLKVEKRGVHPANIGYWDKASEWASWNVQFDKAGTYKVGLDVAALDAGIEATVEVANKTLIARIPQTGDWDKAQGCAAGMVVIKQPGVQTLSVRPTDAAKWNAINLRSVRLTPTE